jgi:putative phosphoribosyl transferase
MIIFNDRREAGEMLAQKLISYKNDPASLILALPRGGVPVAYEVSQKLNLPLDIIVSRKVGHPNQPEFAVCAVTENNFVLCDENIRHYLDPNWLSNEIKKEHQETIRRRKEYKPKRLTIKNKNTILIDDGIATGLTARAAIQEVKNYKPKKVILAVPVISIQVVKNITNLVDELVAINIPDYFGAVGMFYRNFPQLTDKEVIELLNKKYH